jgi:D-glycero-D-manno-heptose 1,7-bisphosphate phosphatase
MNKHSLFLDRDGVINERLPGEYVKTPEEFIFCPGAITAISRLSAHFQRIIVVTNQAGIGKGLMSVTDLDKVHQKMRSEITAAGGRIDAVFFCPNISADQAPCRKPNTAMGLQAQMMFPEIDFHHSWIVGDSISDMEFGQRLGMFTALVVGKEEEVLQQAQLQTNWKGNSLKEFEEWWIGQWI